MAYRNLEVTVISAKDLQDVRTLGLMKVYGQVSIREAKSNQVFYTGADESGGVNPKWNYKCEFKVSESACRREGVSLLINLYCKRTFKHDKYVGDVCIPLDKLFAKARKASLKTYDVLRSGDVIGKLNLSYDIGEKISPVQKPGPAVKNGNSRGGAAAIRDGNGGGKRRAAARRNGNEKGRSGAGGCRNGSGGGGLGAVDLDASLGISIAFNELDIEGNNTTQEEEEQNPENAQELEEEPEDEDELDAEEDEDEDDDDVDEDDEEDEDELDAEEDEDQDDDEVDEDDDEEW